MPAVMKCESATTKSLTASLCAHKSSPVVQRQAQIAPSAAAVMRVSFAMLWNWVTFFV